MPCVINMLETAVEQSLENHPTSRSDTVKIAGPTFVIPIRTLTNWRKPIGGSSLTPGHGLDKLGEAQKLLETPTVDTAAAPGLLTRIHLTSIEDSTSGVLLAASPSLDDQNMMRPWMGNVALGVRSSSIWLASKAIQGSCVTPLRAQPWNGRWPRSTILDS